MIYLFSWEKKCVFFFKFNVHLFLTESETECEWGMGRERGRHRIQNRVQALSCQHSPWWGALTHRPWDRDLSWSRTLNLLSHPGALENVLLKTKMLKTLKLRLALVTMYIILNNFSSLTFDHQSKMYFKFKLHFFFLTAYIDTINIG